MQGCLLRPSGYTLRHPSGLPAGGMGRECKAAFFALRATRCDSLRACRPEAWVVLLRPWWVRPRRVSQLIEMWRSRDLDPEGCRSRRWIFIPGDATGFQLIVARPVYLGPKGFPLAGTPIDRISRARINLDAFCPGPHTEPPQIRSIFDVLVRPSTHPAITHSSLCCATTAAV